MLRELLIDPKRDPEQEYTIHLFEFCNLRCAFCWQNHEDTIGIDNVLDKLPSIEKLISQELRTTVTFNIMGGEVFAPKIFNETLCAGYVQLSEEIKKICDRHNKKFSINWVTNLVIERNDLVQYLLATSKFKGIDARLTTSYDPRGRFNPRDLELFKDNVEFWKDELTCFSCLLTKANIDYYLEHGDEYFDYLYKSGFYIYFDYYMPDEHAQHQMPSDKKLLEFFKWCVDNYPNVHPVKDWIFNKKNYASCRTSKLVLADGTICQCGNLTQTPKSLSMYKTPIKRMDNSGIEDAFLNKYNCSSCEFLDRCTLGCFMNRDYKYLEDLDECVFKLTHRYIEDVRVQKGYEAT